MPDKVQLIKQEIESYKESMKSLWPHSDFRRGQITAYNHILQFIDSLSEESISEDLKKVAKQYVVEDIPPYVNEFTDDSEASDVYSIVEKTFIAGAKWQKQKDQETIELAEDRAMLAGMMKEREEMMKDAVDATIFSELKGSNGSEFQVKSNKFKMNGVKIGDTIKVIPIKTEQQ